MLAKAEATGPTHRKQRVRGVPFGSFRFYVILAVVIVFLHGVDAVLLNMPTLITQGDKEVTNVFQEKQLDLWSEMNKLLIAFATVTIGAIGGFMLNRDKSHPLAPPDLRRAATSWLFCALSLYFGYLSYQQAAQMLKHGVFDSLSPRIWWPARAQFWSYLISIVIFGDFIYSSIRDKRIER
jgi:hypothetical protein